jgi:poly [ADP-ribose] polymerase
MAKVKATAKVTKSTTVKAKNKINKAPKAPKVPKVPKANPVVAPVVVAASSVPVNPISGLVGKGSVLEEGGEVYDNDLAFQDSAKNSNKFYKMQVVEANNKKTYWLVQNWGRVGTTGQSGLKDFNSKAECLKAFHSKFKQKAGVSWENRGQASSNAGGKYRTMTEMRVAQSGGRIADENTVCFCLSWNDHVDLDIHCVMPNG